MSVYLLCEKPVAPGLSRLDFPFTPTIEYGQDVKHEIYGLTHTNYQPYAFTRSENPTISLNCKFSCHTVEHFKQSELALRFLRTYTKMNYGRKDSQRGLPPRILKFFAYGDTMFNDVPVYISKFSMTFPDDVDYVRGEFNSNNEFLTDKRLEKVPGGAQVRNVGAPSNEVQNYDEQSAYDTAGAGLIQQQDDTSDIAVTSSKIKKYSIYMPMLFNINISLLIQQNLHKTVNEFTLENFATGDLMTKGYI